MRDQSLCPSRLAAKGQTGNPDYPRQRQKNVLAAEPSSSPKLSKEHANKILVTAATSTITYIFFLNQKLLHFQLTSVSLSAQHKIGKLFKTYVKMFPLLLPLKSHY